jgi:flagellar biosynthetic protein FliR
MNIDLPTQSAVLFLLLLARLGGIVVFAPVFGSTVVNPIARILLTVALGGAIFPFVSEQLPAPPTEFFPLLLVLAKELLVGMVLGLVAHLILAALQLAGQIMGFQMGFAMVNVIDPQTQVESPVLSILANLTGMLVFLSMNAHHWMLEALVDSYWIVPEPSGISPAFLSLLVDTSGQMFVLSFKLAAPLVVVLFVVDVLVGIVGRAAPQIHVLIVGMPAKALMGFTFLAATIHTMVPFIGRHIDALHDDLYHYLAILGK